MSSDTPREDSLDLEPPATPRRETLLSRGNVLVADFGQPPTDRLLPGEIAELRRMMAEHKLITFHCPIARKALGID
jgi:hypothetical protein